MVPRASRTLRKDLSSGVIGYCPRKGQLSWELGPCNGHQKQALPFQLVFLSASSKLHWTVGRVVGACHHQRSAGGSFSLFMGYGQHTLATLQVSFAPTSLLHYSRNHSLPLSSSSPDADVPVRLNNATTLIVSRLKNDSLVTSYPPRFL